MKKIIVIKLGRNIATTKRNKLDMFRFEHIAKQIIQLQNADFGVVLIISASGICGRKEVRSLSAKKLHRGLISAVGQAYVTSNLYTTFSKHRLLVAEMLLTKADLKDSAKLEQIRTVLRQAAENKIVTIMNENDAVEFCTFKGNDYLACGIAQLINADFLLLMTDVDGVFDSEMKLIDVFLAKQTKLANIEKQNDKGSVGGMAGKIEAAVIAVEHGVDTWILNGKVQNVIAKLCLNNQHIGTRIRI